MDGAANWCPTQGADPAAVAAAGGVDPNAVAPAGSNWRTQLQPEARHRIVNKIMETLKKHLPVSIPEGLTELHKIAVRFEEKIYTAATNQTDYLRKISLKMLSMESQTKTQQNPGNALVIPNQNPPGPEVITASSTMYVEFIECYEATGQLNWLKNFMPGLKVVDDIHRPLKLYCFNEPAVCYAHNNKSSGAAKHVDIKFHIVKDKVRDHSISLDHISTKKMLADPLTKGLPPNVFIEHLAGMGLRESL